MQFNFVLSVRSGSAGEGGLGGVFQVGNGACREEAALPGQVRGARGSGPLLMKYQYIKEKKKNSL